jgi:hypothetical protein
MGPTYKIAELLKISPIAATAYCEKVRSMSGLGSALHYKTIAQYVAQHQNEAPSPQRMVDIMGKNKLPSPPLVKAKQKKVSQLHASSFVKRTASSKRKKKGKTKRYGYEKPVPSPSYLVRTSYFDQERVSEQKLEHCSHGVPHGRVCAICDPKKFREMTGMD